MNKPEEILIALKNDDKKAFKIFFLEYHDVLVLYATNILKDVDAAEDVVQNCFMNVWENSLYKKLTGGLDKYMFCLVKNAALNDLRGNKRREARHEEIVTEMPLVEIMEKDEPDDIEILYSTINQLPPERRRIFMMICAEGKKYQEVADQLQLSINTVRTQMVRSLKFLRGKLKEQMFSILLFYWKKIKF